MNKGIIRLMAAGIAVLVLCVLTGTVWAETTIKVGYIPVGDCVQIYVAEDMGFFKEEGITIEKKPMQGGPLIATAVESGDAQIGWSNTVSIIRAHDKGFDFAYVTTGASEDETHRTHSLLVAKGSPIKTVADLAGKRVAINVLGNINELSMTALADSEGVDIKKIQLVEVPFPNMEVALQKGSVDAAVVIEPFVTLCMMHDSADYLVKPVHKSFGEKFLIASWFAKKSWIAENPETVAKFARAINKATDFINNNRDKVKEILVKNTKLTEDLAGKITLPAFDKKVDEQDLQRMIDLSAKYGFIAKSFPAAEILTKTAIGECQ